MNQALFKVQGTWNTQLLEKDTVLVLQELSLFEDVEILTINCPYRVINTEIKLYPKLSDSTEERG